MPAFESLNEQRRANEANVARRQSISDQSPKGGIFSQFFHKYGLPHPIHAPTLHRANELVLTVVGFQ